MGFNAIIESYICSTVSTIVISATIEYTPKKPKTCYSCRLSLQPCLYHCKHNNATPHSLKGLKRLTIIIVFLASILCSHIAQYASSWYKMLGCSRKSYL